MEEEIKVRFEELDKRIASTENRFGDIKGYFGWVTGLFTIGFSVLGLIFGLNYNSDRNELRNDHREFKKEVREDLGKADLPPNLVLLGENGKPLENQDIKAKFIKNDDETINLTFDYVLKNEGKSSSGPINAKIYISDPIKFNHHSIDESKFKYEAYAHNKNLDPNDIPGGNYMIVYNIKIGIENKKIPPSGKYPILIKVYYGKGRVVHSNFNLILTKQ